MAKPYYPGGGRMPLLIWVVPLLIWVVPLLIWAVPLLIWWVVIIRIKANLSSAKLD